MIGPALLRAFELSYVSHQGGEISAEFEPCLKQNNFHCYSGYIAILNRKTCLCQVSDKNMTDVVFQINLGFINFMLGLNSHEVDCES